MKINFSISPTLHSIIFILTLLVASFANAGLKVGTYNIRYLPGDKGTENAWEARRGDLTDLIKELELDVFGLQEVCPLQALYITNTLPQYTLVGEYREKNRQSGEASSIAFRKDRFELLAEQTFWLSETPDDPGVKGWGAECPRVCTFALLKDKTNGKSLCFANTHLDHVSERARKEGMLLILRKLREHSANLPIILTGDHNSLETWGAAKIAAQTLQNALYKTEIPPQGPWRTLNIWQWRDTEVPATEALKLSVEERNSKQHPVGMRIDYIYVSNGVKVKNYSTIATPRPGLKLYPSDHFPVVAEIELP